MRLAAITIPLLFAACAAETPEPEAPKVNRASVPSLALLEGGTSERRDKAEATGEGPSCEQIINEERRKAEGGHEGEEPPEEQLEEIKTTLNAGSYLGACDVPESASVEVCAAILGGRAVGVTVIVDPGTSSQADCVANAIRRLSFPEHELVSVARTQFAGS